MNHRLANPQHSKAQHNAAQHVTAPWPLTRGHGGGGGNGGDDAAGDELGLHSTAQQGSAGVSMRLSGSELGLRSTAQRAHGKGSALGLSNVEVGQHSTAQHGLRGPHDATHLQLVASGSWGCRSCALGFLSD